MHNNWGVVRNYRGGGLQMIWGWSYFFQRHPNILQFVARRYLVRTPSTKGGEGGLSRPPYDLKNGRLCKLQLFQAIRTIYER